MHTQDSSGQQTTQPSAGSSAASAPPQTSDAAAPAQQGKPQGEVEQSPKAPAVGDRVAAYFVMNGPRTERRWATIKALKDGGRSAELEVEWEPNSSKKVRVTFVRGAGPAAAPCWTPIGE